MNDMQEDKVIHDINCGAINSKKISLELIRDTYCKNSSVYRELDYGHKILKTQEELNQYLYSYAPMTQKQWKYVWNDVAGNVNFVMDSNKNIEVIDYACGQGLASMLFFDKNLWARSITSKITLIEPSPIALNRAKVILQCYAPEVKIKPIEKKLDEITKDDIQTEKDTTKIHLFSNILDIPEFDIPELMNKILENSGFSGLHCFLAVSHARDFCGGTERLNQACDKLLAAKQSVIYKPEIQTFYISPKLEKPIQYFKSILKA